MAKLDPEDMFVLLYKMFQLFVKFYPDYLDDVHFIKVVKTYLQEGGEIASKTFTIRKQVVLDALKWLKEYNVEYKNIEIKESNLDWIENKESQELPPSLIQMDDDHAANNLPASVDLRSIRSADFIRITVQLT